MQIGAISFADEGVEPVLDILVEKAGVNALFLATHTFDNGTGGRQVPGWPLPDHGVQAYDEDFRGGNYATTHERYYRTTPIGDFAAPKRDSAGWDIVERVLPSAQARGVETYCWINENPYSPISSYLDNFALVSEIDPWGRRTGTPCFNNPDYRNWHLSLIEDYLKSYDIDGVAWAWERQGPLGNLIGGGWNTRGVGCWCSHCIRRARDRGSDPEQARRAYVAASDYFTRARAGIRPTDGYFVEFWRLLLTYPEILAWERFWTDGLQDMWAEIYGLSHAIAPETKVGWHLMHLNTLSPFHRAEHDLAHIAKLSDFIKVAMYHVIGGSRFRRWVSALHETIFRDAEPEETYRFLYRILGIDEGEWSDLLQSGFSGEYVRRETARALRGVDGGCEIWPGIDIDIPVEGEVREATPEDVTLAVVAAFEAGAQGVVLSRKYSEMRLANLAGVGEAIRRLGIS